MTAPWALTDHPTATLVAAALECYAVEARSISFVRQAFNRTLRVDAVDRSRYALRLCNGTASTYRAS